MVQKSFVCELACLGENRFRDSGPTKSEKSGQKLDGREDLESAQANMPNNGRTSACEFGAFPLEKRGDFTKMIVNRRFTKMEGFW